MFHRHTKEQKEAKKQAKKEKQAKLKEEYYKRKEEKLQRDVDRYNAYCDLEEIRQENGYYDRDTGRGEVVEICFQCTNLLCCLGCLLFC